MRQVLVTVGFGLAVGGCWSVASAQVTVNPQALRQLAGKPAVAPPARPIVARPVRPILRHPIVTTPVRTPKLPLPPPPVTIAAVAPTKPAVPRGVTLLFPDVAVALPPSQSRVLVAFIGRRLNRAAHFVVQATAPGMAGDPSVARRMALNRGLAVRRALRRAGVASDHIIVQALGDPPGIVPDHVTLTEIP
ncbi:hypothetical protein [Acidiphilium sp.]|uniref:hypothetical protein n=1 Tax=Acidiphilium sp. TaxID=527 RepID=UPI003D026F9D